MNIDLITIILGSSVIASIVTFFLSRLDKVLDNNTAKKELLKNDRRELANEIISLCAEAKAKKFISLPDNEQKIAALIYKVSLEDTKIFVKLNTFINYWRDGCTSFEPNKDFNISWTPEAIESFRAIKAELTAGTAKELLYSIKPWRR